MNTDPLTIYQMLAFTELKCQKAPKITLKEKNSLDVSFQKL